MIVWRSLPGLWVTALLTIGTALALLLLAQTVVTYRYVSRSLIQEEATRIAQDAVRAVERSARLSRPQNAQAFAELLDDVRSERSGQVAWLVLRQGGIPWVRSGEPAGRDQPAESSRVPGGPRIDLTEESSGGRDVLVGSFPCRCGLQGNAVTPTGRPFDQPRSLMEVALYRDSLAAPFARLRRNAVISASAALTLLLSLLIIAVRFHSYVRGKQLEAQVTLAREVQRNLLPAGDSPSSSLDVAAECLPASHVGGDFYDIVGLPGGRLAFVVGDVSGHGIAAALVMSLIHGAMSGPPWGVAEDEADRASRLNDLLLRKTSNERFASLFWCSFDPASGRLRYINAGHPPPLWMRRSADSVGVQRLAEGGPVLGLIDVARYHTQSIEARAGDVLVLFSDGLVEATNRDGDFFGEERLIDAVRRSASLSARAICDDVLKAVKAFSGAGPIQDDQTLLVVRLPERTELPTPHRVDASA